jgi:hypothetical protein
MKRITITIVVTLVTLALALLIYAQKQRSPRGQSAESNSNTASEAKVQKPKGKLLVKKLPEGVMLKDGVVTAKPGYKFVEGEDGKVRVAFVKGGGGLSIGGTWDCNCSGKGSCAKFQTADMMQCISDSDKPCSGECTLTATTKKGITQRIMAW